jgi:beta-glucanase (GH16 family)
LHGAKGAWPAIWMLAQDSEWPDGGEIDIMERLNFDSIAYQTIHSNYTYRLKIKDNPKQGSTGIINPHKFNTYAVEKYADSLVFFINNKRTFAYPRIKTDKEGQFPFDKHKHYLLIDMQLGGSWVGSIGQNDLPVEMEIDWVRFYEFKNNNK